MARQLIVFLVLVFGIHSVFADVMQQPSVDDDFASAESEEEKINIVGAVIAIGLAAGAVGAGGYFLYRRAKHQRHYADSVITSVEGLWNRASILYASEKYREAVRQLQLITASWYEYEKCSRKYRQKRHVHPDSIKAVIASCDFLESMITPIRNISRRAERLPVDEYGLSRMSRREILTLRNSLQKSMDSILVRYPNHRIGLRHSMRHISRRIRMADSLQNASYAQRKRDFVVKNRFYYNRAMESGDTAALHSFVDDCGFYQVDKEWCQRARIALKDYAERSPATLSPPKKMSTNDSIRYAYKQAMQSRQIEVLEEYIKKYSGRRYRRRRRIAKVDNVRKALGRLRREINAVIAFNKSYPRFGNGDIDDIDITIRGLSKSAEVSFNLSWKELKQELTKLPSIRLPASLLIDYANQPPTILFDAIASPEYDMEELQVNGRKAFRVNALFPAVSLMHKCKLMAIDKLKRSKSKSYGDNKVITYQIEKVAAANYILRLRKPGNRGAIVFYARGVVDERDSSSTLVYYDFYDLSTSRHHLKRFPIYPSTLPNVIPSLSSDPLELEMGTAFFK